MKRYRVVVREYYTVEVEAENKQQAGQEALDVEDPTITSQEVILIHELLSPDDRKRGGNRA